VRDRVSPGFHPFTRATAFTAAVEVPWFHGDITCGAVPTQSLLIF